MSQVIEVEKAWKCVKDAKTLQDTENLIQTVLRYIVRASRRLETRIVLPLPKPVPVRTPPPAGRGPAIFVPGPAPRLPEKPLDLSEIEKLLRDYLSEIAFYGRIARCFRENALPQRKGPRRRRWVGSRIISE